MKRYGITLVVVGILLCIFGMLRMAFRPEPHFIDLMPVYPTNLPRYNLGDYGFSQTNSGPRNAAILKLVNDKAMKETTNGYLITMPPGSFQLWSSNTIRNSRWYVAPKDYK